MTSSQEMTKNEWRAEIRSRHLALRGDSRIQAEKKIEERLSQFASRHPLGTVFTFHPFRDEPRVWTAFERMAQTRSLAIPRTESDGRMTFHMWRVGDAIVQGQFGISEPLPTAAVATPQSQDIIVVPCMAADLKGVRLGYGKGYYDRYLAQHPFPIRVGVLFECGIVATLPREVHDATLDFIITETSERIVRGR